jgi:hypothetical protein
MKRFLLRLGVFAFLVAFGYVAALVVIVFLNRRALPNCRLEKPVDSIIIGDSHPMWAIDDTDIAGLRNIALNAEGYKYSYQKLKHLLATEKGIKKIYIGYSHHNLAGYYDEYISGPTFANFIERYLAILDPGDYLQLAAENPSNVLDFTQRILQRGWRPALNRRCQIYGSFPGQPMTAKFNLASMEKRIREQYYLNGDVAPPSAANIEYLRKLVELSRQHGLEIVMLKTPQHKTYEARIPEAYHRRYASFLQENGLKAYGFEDLEVTDAEVLPDGDHLNLEGALATTRRFKQYHESAK